MGSSALLRDFPGWARADTLDLRDVGNPDLCPLEELHLLPEKYHCSLTSAMFVVGGGGPGLGIPSVPGGGDETSGRVYE